MDHPFLRLPTNRLVVVFFPLLLGTLILMIVMNAVGAPLQTSAAPIGIISFELAGSTIRMAQILDSWDGIARVAAGFSLGLDYLFMVAYSTTIGLGCIWAAGVLRSRGWPLAGPGVPLAWGQWLAAVLDAVENAGLIVILFGGAMQPWALLARWCAIIKFALIFAGLTYVFLGLVIRLVVKPSN